MAVRSSILGNSRYKIIERFMRNKRADGQRDLSGGFKEDDDMKIGGNGSEQERITMYVSGGKKDDSRLSRREKYEKNSQVKEGSVFMGDLKKDKSRIEEKKEQSQNKIAKLLGDQFAEDTKIDQNLDEIREHQKALAKQASELNGEISELKADKEELKEKFGIKDDSQEQKDLELMEKVRDAKKNGKLSELSSEELEEFAGLGPLTDYQKEALARDEVISQDEQELSRIMDESAAGTKAIISTKLAVLGRQYDMTDVGYAVEEEKKAAGKEIMGMAVQDAKDHIDEEMEKLKAEAEKAAEKKKEEEEAAEKNKEKTPEEAQADRQREAAEDIQEGPQGQDGLSRQLKKIMEDGKLVEEDLKGLMVNENL